MILILNGASSAGKSSIIKEFCTISDDLFLTMGCDKFMSMVPSKFQNSKDGAIDMWHWEKNSDRFGDVMKLAMGPDGKRYVLAMYECIALMARHNYNIIVDDVFLHVDIMKEVADKLSLFKVYFIGITCNLDVLEERERLRANRIITSARGQYEIVHGNYEYDLMVDTTFLSAHECALQIKKFIESNDEPQGIRLIKKNKK